MKKFKDRFPIFGFFASILLFVLFYHLMILELLMSAFFLTAITLIVFLESLSDIDENKRS